MRSFLLAVLFTGVVVAESFHVAPRATGPASVPGSNNNFMGAQACGVALKALPDPSAFCTSYVGGVETKTVSTVETQNVIATRTNMVTIVVTPSTKYATLSATTTKTVSAPTLTITTSASVLTTTITRTVTSTSTNVFVQYSAGRTCNAKPVSKRDNSLEPRFGARPIGQFAPAIISQACSSYIIETPTVTSTQTVRVTSTSQVSEKTRITKPTLTSTRLVTQTDTSTITPLRTRTMSVIGFTETVTTTVVSQQTPLAACNAASGLVCESGTCTCPVTAPQCNGVCGTHFMCHGNLYSEELVGTGVGPEGFFVCAYGYGSADPAYGGSVACYYSNESGAAIASRSGGLDYPPSTWGCDIYRPTPCS